MTDAVILSDEQKEFAKFLDRDFNQCFQQMRHYDGQILDICKFAFTGYIAVAGVALALYKYGDDKGIDYSGPAVAILSLAVLFGLLFLGLVVRNRVYFVLVTRYINEHRRFFLKDSPLGFANETKMYANPAQPPYFSWLSSQAWLLYLLAILNAGVFVTALAIAYKADGRWWWQAGLPAIPLVVAQISVAISYLRRRERKSASAAVWGKE